MVLIKIFKKLPFKCLLAAALIENQITAYAQFAMEVCRFIRFDLSFQQKLESNNFLIRNTRVNERSND